MKIEISPNIDKHRYNKNYPCLIVQFERAYDKAFNFARSEWLPKSYEVLAIASTLAALDDSFRRDLMFALTKQEQKVVGIDARRKLVSSPCASSLPAQIAAGLCPRGE